MIAWKCVNECVKVSPMEFSAWVNTFLGLNILKLAEIAKLYVKLWESVWIGVWKYHISQSMDFFGILSLSTYFLEPNILKMPEIAKLCEKLCENCILNAWMCVNEYKRVHESISNEFSPHYFLIPKMLKLGHEWLNAIWLHESVWKYY